jgi:hypothetical protein
MLADLETRSKSVRYLKRERGNWKHVMYEIAANGTETFYDQEPGEVRWFKFQPSDRESFTARWVLHHENGRSCEEPILDLDVPLTDYFMADTCTESGMG